MISFSPLKFNFVITTLFLIQIYSPATGQICDFNFDLSCDCTDIDLLNNEIATGGMNLSFDVDGDNDVDFDDKLSWLIAAGTSLEDVNLDGMVSPIDLLILVNNFNTINASHCSGDVNADGMINDLDAAILLEVFTGGVVSWLGSSDANWHNSSNWDVGLIPFADADVHISNTLNNPVVIQNSNTGLAESLLISGTSALTIQNGGALFIQGTQDPLLVMGELVIMEGGTLDVSIN